MKLKAKNKGLALEVVNEASSSDDDKEMALLVRKFMKFIRKGAKPSDKYSRDTEVKKSFTSPHEMSGHAKSNRKVQCFKCKKLGHYASDCPSGDSKKDKKGKAMAATWSEDDDSSDEESSSDESSSEEELVSNFVAFTASHSILEDVCQDSLDKEDDLNHQDCLSEDSTIIDLLAKMNCLKENLKIALREIDEKDDKASKKRRSKKKNKLKNKVPLETPICASPIPEGKISSFVPICHFCNIVGHIKLKYFKFIEYCNIGSASRDREIGLHFKNAKAFEYGKHDDVTKHVKNARNVKNGNLAKFDNVCVANNVEKKSINDIIVNQVVEELYSRFNIVVKENLDNVCVGSPKTKFVKGECSYQ
ncbi:hypothetical protein Q3G72_014685 [Acer saccharum]|nr:hypothetical protein Q3G72_014685 [Acer saccharum]